jgi:hypothetical protein
VIAQEHILPYHFLNAGRRNKCVTSSKEVPVGRTLIQVYIGIMMYVECINLHEARYISGIVYLSHCTTGYDTNHLKKIGQHLHLNDDENR